MTLDEYQNAAQKTASHDEVFIIRLATAGLGIAGEAGEVADHIKKVVGHKHPPDGVKILKELGDVLWYVAELSTLNGFTLEQVAQANVTKLHARYPEGFMPERSMNRDPA